LEYKKIAAGFCLPSPADVTRDLYEVEAPKDDVVHLHGVGGSEGGPAKITQHYNSGAD
jgi:hypothetical protein